MTGKRLTMSCVALLGVLMTGNIKSKEYLEPLTAKASLQGRHSDAAGNCCLEEKAHAETSRRIYDQARLLLHRPAN